MLSIAIVEDKDEHIQQLKSILRDYQTERKEELSIDVFKNGLNFIEEYKPSYDIVFMDISMPVMDGMEASRRLRERDGNVDLIFTTVLKQYSLFGYDVNASAFLIKPFDEEMLKAKLDKIIKRRRLEKEEGWIFLKDNVYIKVLNRDITYIESLDHYCIFHTHQDQEYRKLISMKEVQNKMEKSGFLRCNNSFLINPVYVEKYKKDSIFVDGKAIPISRSRKKEFFIALADAFGDKYQ